MLRKSARAGAPTEQEVDSDSPWKEMLERYFPDFLAFFFPAAYADIDWSRGYKFLDTELQKVTRKARLGRRYVDKLVQVWLKDGSEVWALIHIEIQAKREEIFPRRMFVYNYRLFDRYDHAVMSFAVLADAQSDWRPNRFEYGRWGSQMSLTFPIVKLLDYTTQWDTLEKDPNPFSVVVMAHLKTLETRRKPARRLEWRVHLTRLLYHRGYDRDDVLELLRFLEWMMALPDNLEIEYDRSLEAIEGETKMPYVLRRERLGIEKGIEIGIEKGRLEVLRADVVDNLEARFQDVSSLVLERIYSLEDQERLRSLRRLATTAPNLEVFIQEAGL